MKMSADPKEQTNQKLLNAGKRSTPTEQKHSANEKQDCQDIQFSSGGEVFYLKEYKDLDEITQYVCKFMGKTSIEQRLSDFYGKDLYLI